MLNNKATRKGLLPLCLVMASSWLLLYYAIEIVGEMIEIEPTPDEARFWQWLKDGGADVSAIGWPAMDPITGSRGVVAKRDILDSADGKDVYLRVPEHLMITEARALKDPDFGKAIASYQANDYENKEDNIWLTEYDRLALYIIFQANKTDSFFYPYTRIIPEPSMLIDWTEEEQKETQDDLLLEKARVHLEAWKSRLAVGKTLSPQHFPPELFTWKRIHWALGSIAQRAFSIRDNNDVVLYNALVPGADLLNHVNIATHYKMVDDHYILYPVRRTIKKGQECYNGYGLLSNAHLLESYGFALRGNVYDVVIVNLLPHSTTTGKHQVELYDSTSDRDVGSIILEFPGKLKSEKLKTCSVACKTKLSSYPTTLEEDEKLLQSLDKSDASKLRLRFALYHRIGQKIILNNYMTYCEQLLKVRGVDGMSNRTFSDYVSKMIREISSASKGWFSKLAAWLPDPWTFISNDQNQDENAEL